MRYQNMGVVPMLCIVLFGCAREPIAAKVNGEVIKKKEISVLLEHGGIKGGLKGIPEGDDRHRPLRQEVLNRLIDERLVIQVARKDNIKMDNKEVMNAYRDIIGSFPDEKEYLKRLKERRLSKDIVLKSIERGLTMRKFKESLLKDIVISDTELKEHYDKNIKTFTTNEEIRLSVIKVNDIQEAKMIKREIEKGVTFEDMAKKYPAGHTGPGSGETGWVTIDTFPQDMVKEIRKIKTGAFGGPIKGREGYYLIKVQERKEKRVQPFDEVKEKIRHILMQQRKEERFQRWLQEQKGKAKIEIIEKG
jgi:foldase protein PrsA